ncbi:YciI family protein, partial [Streptomyces sp. NPDC017966]|uniref:YciI family protein n=1 Tax=Streptomyces sp. NPDC017966 TaxID=3365023 RepID=UPI0037AF92A4
MEFFCYHRDRPGSLALREELLEEHWSYMDRYAKELIARGPTFADGWRPAVWCRGSPQLNARVLLPRVHRLPVTAP